MYFLYFCSWIIEQLSGGFSEKMFTWLGHLIDWHVYCKNGLFGFKSTSREILYLFVSHSGVLQQSRKKFLGKEKLLFLLLTLLHSTYKLIKIALRPLKFLRNAVACVFICQGSKYTSSNFSVPWIFFCEIERKCIMFNNWLLCKFQTYFILYLILVGELAN